MTHCQPCPIWPPVAPLNLKPALLTLSKMLSVAQTFWYGWHFSFQTSCHVRRICPSLRLYSTFLISWGLMWGLLAARYPQNEGLSLLSELDCLLSTLSLHYVLDKQGLWTFLQISHPISNKRQWSASLSGCFHFLIIIQIRRAVSSCPEHEIKYKVTENASLIFRYILFVSPRKRIYQ